MPGLLVIEDDFPLRRFLSKLLTRAGYTVRAAASAEEAGELVVAERPDLALLDWNLPGISGLELLKGWRARGYAFPIIMVTSHTEVPDRVAGLEAGADDYLVKPFASDELLARVTAHLRRAGTSAGGTAPNGTPNVLELVDRTVDLRRQCIEEGAEHKSLTEREAQVLSYLAERPGVPVSRNELLENVWGYKNPAHLRTRAVDNAIYRLRAKIERDVNDPRHLLTVHGRGYRFDP